MNILLCTLGVSWTVVPEIFGFVAPSRLDLYANHPGKVALQAMRLSYGLREPDEIWVCSTCGESTARSKAAIEVWSRLLSNPVPVRFWLASGTDQLDSQPECDKVRELTFRLVLKASENVGVSGQLLLSLAGGRKTMSADLQSAGEIFGATAWMHVVGPSKMPPELSSGATPAGFAAPLQAELAAFVQPLVVGRGLRSDLLDVELKGRRVTSDRFHLPLAERVLEWDAGLSEESLFVELDQRRLMGSRLLGNFVATVKEQCPLDNWHSLLRLPPAEINALRTTIVDSRSKAWLTTLPKADLHRHVGGCLDLQDQRDVGKAIWEAADGAARSDALDIVGALLKTSTDWPWDWPTLLVGASRSLRAAALLVHASDELLERNLYGVTEQRLALRNGPRGFQSYERPGELTGSAVLTHPAALEPYARALVYQARVEGLTYLELRGSPHKYRPQDPSGFLKDFRAALVKAGAWSPGGPSIGFVWILDRRNPATMPAVIDEAVQAHESMGDFLFGLDLAGDEGTNFPERLAPYFLPAFRACLKVTIHAGEGESVESIWEAAYHLHADRIGHGLSILDNHKLRDRFRDRGTCIELCPTSNREVVGFADPEWPDSKGLKPYPLKAFLDAGLSMVICTDNPGISRTSLANEFIAASRMSLGGMSKWTALALMRESFSKSFAPAVLREKLISDAEHLVLDCCTATVHGLDT